jgi:hypothetical protein
LYWIELESMAVVQPMKRFLAERIVAGLKQFGTVRAVELTSFVWHRTNEWRFYAGHSNLFNVQPEEPGVSQTFESRRAVRRL